MICCSTTLYSSKSSSLILKPISKGAVICSEERKTNRVTGTTQGGVGMSVVSTYCDVVVLGGLARLLHDMAADSGRLRLVLWVIVQLYIRSSNADGDKHTSQVFNTVYSSRLYSSSSTSIQ